MKDRIIILVLITIMILNAMDVFVDIQLNVPIWHVLGESIIVIVSAIAALLLIHDLRLRSRSLNRLATKLKDANIQIQTLSGEIASERKHYAQVIQAQFNDWGLTVGEQQVAILILKGLSLKEIASVRDTKEATVRQQASSLYSKSNLQGRHELSAWFLEDFLN
ncbi:MULTISPECIES: helix-turn-helix transcriptional regulator [Alteromonadaceae]|uniref:helix-turn-helix transcriptional regulator n=1 Tax=Alteromonadaceae TaxID=72275 RepID=UPI001C087CFD|nr:MULTISPECIES: LuxR C-terminal-related transcriptional regulator [Aliiglaciecola]MBU2880105.1 LuxR C-terminal-related transcriptional regulator [Aliiglaciecola lipolytica]MDO6710897.1 LuxR C-terminal-related transcriptional regulator [Aliiglaciecola sp. 2_MG-2023]MDO6752378.1 LuxR C-terminal-related transcriptional regulator [Aliiglaciecola sp. 1_MG-2023]